MVGGKGRNLLDSNLLDLEWQDKKTLDLAVWGAGNTFHPPCPSGTSYLKKVVTGFFFKNSKLFCLIYFIVI